jgi:hypothetical protein
MSPHWKVLAMALAIASATPVPVVAQARFDGRWTVSATVDDGGCTGPYRYPIVVRDGVVDDASGSAADGSGRWTLTGPISCSGRWTSSKSS